MKKTLGVVLVMLVALMTGCPSAVVPPVDPPVVIPPVDHSKDFGSIELSFDSAVSQSGKSLSGDDYYNLEQALKDSVASVKVTLYDKSCGMPLVDDQQIDACANSRKFEIPIDIGQQLVTLSNIKPGFYFLLADYIKPASDGVEAQTVFSARTEVLVTGGVTTPCRVTPVMAEKISLRFEVSGWPCPLGNQYAVIHTHAGDIDGEVGKDGLFYFTLPMDFEYGQLETNGVFCDLSLRVYDVIVNGLSRVPFVASRAFGEIVIDDNFDNDFTPQWNPLTVSHFGQVNQLRQIVADGKNVYAIGYNNNADGLVKIDVSDKSAPAVTAFNPSPYSWYPGNVPGPSSTYCDDTCLVVDDSVAYVGMLSNGIRAVSLDQSDPSINFETLSTLYWGKWIFAMETKNRYLFVLDARSNTPGGWSEAGLTVIDAYNPSQMRIVASLPLPVSMAMVRSDNSLFVSSGGNQIVEIDISDPLSPQIKQSFLAYTVWKLEVDSRNKLLFTLGHNGLTAYDISQPGTTTVLAHYGLTSYYADNAMEMQLVGKYLYLTEYNGGLLTFDVSQAASGTITALNPGLAYGLNWAEHFAIYGRYMYCGFNLSPGGFGIVDLSQSADQRG